jgi:hypothetical protein
MKKIYICEEKAFSSMKKAYTYLSELTGKEVPNFGLLTSCKDKNSLVIRYFKTYGKEKIEVSKEEHTFLFNIYLFPSCSKTLNKPNDTTKYGSELVFFIGDKKDIYSIKTLNVY